MRTLTLAAALLLPVPALAQDASSCQPADLAALDDWRGVWIAEGNVFDLNGRRAVDGGTGGWRLLGGDAPWSDRGWQNIEAFGRTTVSGGERFSVGWSFPIMMQNAAPLRFVVSPKETVITSQYRDIRYIPTDGSPMPAEDQRWPTIWGTSVGCWEGDMLVIETASAHYTPEYNAFAPPLSDEATFVERIRMTGPDRIENVITITDPVTLSRPWTEHIAYVRHPVLDRMVHEGDMVTANRIIEVDGQVTIAPPAEIGPPPIPEFPAEIVLPVAELERYVGRYAFNGPPLTLIIERRDNRLLAVVEPGLPLRLPIYADGPGAFHSRGLVPMRLQFDLDAGGRAVRFSGISAEAMPISGTRVE